MTPRAILILVFSLIFAIGLASWSVAVFFRYGYTPIIPVRVLNDSRATVEFSCSGFDTPHADPGDSTSITLNVGKNEHCLVYRLGGAKYLGCLSVDTRQGSTLPRQRLSRVLTPLSEDHCL